MRWLSCQILPDYLQAIFNLGRPGKWLAQAYPRAWSLLGGSEKPNYVFVNKA